LWRGTLVGLPGILAVGVGGYYVILLVEGVAQIVAKSRLVIDDCNMFHISNTSILYNSVDAQSQRHSR